MTLTFNPGDTVQCFYIATTDDTIFEYNETLSAVLSTQDSDVLLVNSMVIISIIDDDNGEVAVVLVGVDLGVGSWEPPPPPPPPTHTHTHPYTPTHILDPIELPPPTCIHYYY